MTNYLPPLDEQFGAQQADLLRRIATLEQQVNHLATLNGVILSGTPITGQVPTATSASTATWQTPSAGGGAMTQVAHQLLSSTSGSVTLTPSGGTFDRMLVIARAATSTGSAQDMYMQVDGDTGAHYAWQKASANAGTFFTTGTYGASHFQCGVFAGTSSAVFSTGTFTFTGWSSSTINLSWDETWSGFDGSNTWTETYSGMYTPTTPGPHTSITFFPHTGLFAVGTEFTMYGLS